MTYEQSQTSHSPCAPGASPYQGRSLCSRVFGGSAVLLALSLTPLLAACDVDENEPETSGVDLDDSDDDVQDDAEENDAGADDDSGDQDAGAGSDDGDVGTSDGGLNEEAGLSAEAGVIEGGADNGGPLVPSPIRGYVVVNSDYSSSTVSVVDTEGDVLSSALLTAGAAGAALSLPLSSDIVLPTSVMKGEEIVIVDRTNSVITWVELESAEVARQLNVGPGGFVANPYDYVPYADDKAFVTRFASNGDPGQADFDEGGDVLIIDPSEPEIVGRIELADAFDEDESDLQPHPDSAVLSGGTLYVMLAAIDADFAVYGPPRLVSIDPDSNEITDVLVIEGMRNCGEFRLSPNEQLMAIGCIGDWGDPIATSGIALMDISGSVPALVEAFSAEDLAEQQVSAVEFATNELLVFTVTGAYDEDYNALSSDELHWLSIESGDWSETPVIESVQPYSLGELRCAHVEGTCVLTDAETDYGVLRLLEIDDGEVEVLSQVKVDDGVGLPPRYLGKF